MSLSAISLLLALADPQSPLPAAGQNLDQFVNEFIRKNQVPGVSIVVTRRGRTVLSKGYGYADLEHRVRMSANSVHELASVSKQFTATSILLLVQDGKLKLDDPLVNFADFPPAAWKAITIRHLLQHTSGLPDYLANSSDIRTEATTTELLAAVAKKPLVFAPGSKFEYSNTGYMALGHIIAKVSGKSATEFVIERIAKPLGMTQTYANDPRAIIPNRAIGYTLENKKLVLEDYTSRSYSMTADGHLLSSARDLAKWGDALRAKKLIRPDLAAEAWTGSAVSNGTYGFGWGTARKNGKLRLVHTGGWYGTSTFLMTAIDEGVTIAILANTDSAEMNPFLQRVVEEFLPPEK
ncbi:MAG: serine hydrolase domain-containing protein [Fimbriimonas sp.]